MNVTGIDASRVAAYLEHAVPGATAPFDIRLVSGGRSNLTYAVTDQAGERLVLRRPPLGDVLPSAHDVVREARIMRALAPTDVPVPDVPAVCHDPTVTGAPFSVMRFVDGAIVRDAVEAQGLPAPVRAAAGPRLAEALARLHHVEPAAVGLGDLGRRHGYVERQLRRWSRQWDAVRDRDVAEVDEAHRRLAAAVPPQRRTAIVHGDFRLDNVVLGPDGAIRAVLDWELCTLGDPRADVGMLAVYWVAPGEPTDHLLSGTPTAAGGFCDRAELLRHYGGDLDDLEFFKALGLWKLACIAEGIRVRETSGAMGTAAADTGLADRVRALASAALDVLSG